MRSLPAVARRVANRIVLGLLLLCTACSPGKIELVSLQFKTIDPPRPQAIEVELQHAHWQETESGRLQITASREATIPIVNLRQRVLFSLELERLPRGKAKEYKLDRQTLRGYVEVGPQQGRFESLGGIAVVYGTDDENSIRVLFRLIANRYRLIRSPHLSLCPGCPGRVLCCCRVG